MAESFVGAVVTGVIAAAGAVGIQCIPQDPLQMVLAYFPVPQTKAHNLMILVIQIVS